MLNILYVLVVICVVKEAEMSIFPLIGSDYFSSGLNLFRFPITFYDFTIGVNFFGFHASAGLAGGLLAKRWSPGGPHAEASTPFGQSAGAGLGMRFENGSTIGYLYAEAQLGREVFGVCVLLSELYVTGVKILPWNKCASTLNITVP
ncbi:hypothetical protein Zmor_010882 [Zophobas morio]|uniref:Uncharacterized protein n=1 Tax=Zophobas morio TaxID=2755281 RepID=A0AA38IQB2_9CUCU|nr:hypothetical protein Zmor_010882 [Zophobas morio]